MTLAHDASKLIRASRGGVLATTSVRMPGYPFGSAVSWAVMHDGSLLLLISRLAEHTRNIEADPRVSLTVLAPGIDVQTAARVTALGDCLRARVHDDERDRYLRLFPRAAAYLALDFDFFRLVPRAVRVVAGFGAMRWIDEPVLAGTPGLASVEASMIARLEVAYHASISRRFVAALGRKPADGRIAGLDREGIDLCAEGAAVRLDFAHPMPDPAGVEQAAIGLLESR